MSDHDPTDAMMRDFDRRYAESLDPDEGDVADPAWRLAIYRARDRDRKSDQRRRKQSGPRKRTSSPKAADPIGDEAWWDSLLEES